MTFYIESFVILNAYFFARSLRVHFNEFMAMQKSCEFLARRKSDRAPHQTLAVLTAITLSTLSISNHRILKLDHHLYLFPNNWSFFIVLSLLTSSAMGFTLDGAKAARLLLLQFPVEAIAGAVKCNPAII